MNTIRRYMDQEYINQHADQLECWIYIRPESMTLVYAHVPEKRIAGVIQAEAMGLMSYSLSQWTAFIDSLLLTTVSDQHIIWVSSTYTIVPEALFAGEKADTMYELVHPLQQSDELLYQNVSGKVVLYAVNNLVLRTLRVVFPGAGITHYAKHLLQSLESLLPYTSDRLFVQIHTNKMDIWYTKKQQLIFHNTFDIDADTDIIYFILAVSEQLQLTTDKMHVLLSGYINQRSTLLPLLKKYIPQVSVVARLHDWEYAAAIKEMPDSHYFLELIGPLCASFQAH